MRKCDIKRDTLETQIELSLNIDGSGESQINTGCGFLDHMLVLFAKHGRFDLNVKCTGDTHVDYHHSVEDIGICLGKAFKKCLGDMMGIYRYADIILPMDEALITCAVDISGRGYLNYGLEVPSKRVGDFDTELVEEFMLAFVRNANLTLHIVQNAGNNTHHIIEGTFKALGRVMNQATKLDKDYLMEIPSTKGVL